MLLSAPFRTAGFITTFLSNLLIHFSGALRLVVNVEGKLGKYESGVFDILTLLAESGELWHLRKSWPLCITDGPAMRPPPSSDGMKIYKRLPISFTTTDAP